MGSVFEFKSWQFDPVNGQLDLFYIDSKYGDFCERFLFPVFEGEVLVEQYAKRKVVIDQAIEQLFWMVGVSYYKTQLAESLVFQGNKPAPDQAQWLTQTWQSGLAELAHQNDLPWLSHIVFPSDSSAAELIAPQTLQSLSLRPRSLVAIGGGKDSLVSIEFLKRQKEDLCLFMVGNSEFIQEVAAQTGCELLQVKRQVDTALKISNDAGAYNGHIPITAINSCVAAVAALLYDFDAIVFSNERSADVGNVQIESGQWVNHQYSKSFEFEQAFQELIKNHLTKNLSYFSLLRPFSELAIVKQFAKLTQYFPHFSSCNRNFHLAGSQNQLGHWCGQCPKCAFVFLVLAPFIPRATLEGIFGKNLLSDKGLLPLYQELLGLEGIKPFECVGEVEESQWAFNQLIADPEWSGLEVLEILAKHIVHSEIDDIKLLFEHSNKHQIPEKRCFQNIFDEFVAS
ncbi:endonuclease domain-containing protein [Marinicella rhabdoformis]|uniref:endonuclease domain-containing protein n=1 Tax=Marinicella rhabdoformis TaxID=2580566 RepID=UPI0012AECE71|nr:endonuclease domain-containing protein [Marinicella rhabdoformis]